jgi:hypothetical protein
VNASTARALAESPWYALGAAGGAVQLDHALRVAWLVEPRAINPLSYEFAAAHAARFDLVLTHDARLARALPNAALCPLGTSLVPPAQRALHAKTRLVSHLASGRSAAPGHHLRHAITDAHCAAGPAPPRPAPPRPARVTRVAAAGRLACFGESAGAPVLPSKAAALVPFMFAFAIENSQAGLRPGAARHAAWRRARAAA